MVAQTHDTLALALLEVGNLTPALLVADRCAKSARVRIVDIESTDSAAQCIKLVGATADVREAGSICLPARKLMEIADKCPVHRTLHSEVLIPTRLA